MTNLPLESRVIGGLNSTGWPRHDALGYVQPSRRLCRRGSPKQKTMIAVGAPPFLVMIAKDQQVVVFAFPKLMGFVFAPVQKLFRLSHRETPRPSPGGRL